jgi:peptidyl-tRNA hydrolase, PTH1 family
MKVVVGLGNPGTKYEKTRHNAGYIFVEKMADYIGWDSYYDVDEWKHDKGKRYEVCRAMVEGQPRILFFKPVVFMNTSGLAVKDIVDEYDVKVESDLLLAHDDLDIPLGKYKIQSGASPKEHKGVKHVEHMIAKIDFLRIRIGVDSREGDRSVPGEQYVLEKFSEEELVVLDEAIAKCIKNLRSILEL